MYIYVLDQFKPRTVVCLSIYTIKLISATQHVVNIYKRQRIRRQSLLSMNRQNFPIRAETLLIISWENEPARVLNDFLCLICLTSSLFPDLFDLMCSTRQSRSQSPRSSVGGIVRLWEKAQKNAQNSLHSITIGSSTIGTRAIFKLLNDGALAS